jgi:hypothetical protein
MAFVILANSNYVQDLLPCKMLKSSLILLLTPHIQSTKKSCWFYLQESSHFSSLLLLTSWSKLPQIPSSSLSLFYYNRPIIGYHCFSTHGDTILSGNQITSLLYSTPSNVFPPHFKYIPKSLWCPARLHTLDLKAVLLPLSPDSFCFHYLVSRKLRRCSSCCSKNMTFLLQGFALSHTLLGNDIHKAFFLISFLSVYQQDQLLYNT